MSNASGSQEIYCIQGKFDNFSWVGWEHTYYTEKQSAEFRLKQLLQNQEHTLISPYWQFRITKYVPALEIKPLIEPTERILTL